MNELFVLGLIKTHIKKMGKMWWKKKIENMYLDFFNIHTLPVNTEQYRNISVL